MKPIRKEMVKIGWWDPIYPPENVSRKVCDKIDDEIEDKVREQIHFRVRNFIINTI